MAFITRTTTLEAIIASEPEAIWYSTLTCWWTHRKDDLNQHPETKDLCDPRGGPVFELKPASHVKEWFRLAKVKAREGVYGKHGLAAFIAAHNDNCQVSQFDERPTCLTTYREYSVQIDVQAALPISKPLIRDADLSLGPIPEKTVVHEPNLRILERDGGDGLDDGPEDGGEDES